MYAYAWAILLLPLGGLAFSFVAETPRRAAQVCMGFMGAALVMALIVLGYRLAHETISVTPNFSTLNFLSLTPDPSETTTFPATFQVAVGVRVDNLSASFMTLIPVLVLAVQGLGTAMLERDAGYRRFFWASSLLAAAMIAVVASPGLFQLWLGLGVGTATTLVLALHWWHRSGTGAVARRAFMVLAGADVVLLLAMAFVVDKLGAFIGLETVPSSGAFDITDFRLLDPAWKAAGPLDGHRPRLPQPGDLQRPPGGRRPGAGGPAPRSPDGCPDFVRLRCRCSAPSRSHCSAGWFCSPGSTSC